jgi:hypothetical protein
VRGRLLAAGAMTVLCLDAGPASAATAGNEVYADLGACLTITSPVPLTGTGTFTAAGAVSGPGTLAAPVAGARPVVMVGQTTWYGCLPGAYAGAMAGGAVYTLVFNTADATFVDVTRCDVRRGSVTCV